MADRRALVITTPGVIGLHEAAELIPGPGEVVARPVIAEGIIPDRVCAQCVQGHTNLRLVYDELGFTRSGAAADQVLLPAQAAFPAQCELAEGPAWDAARENFTPDDLRAQPQAGDIFACTPGVTGRLPYLFGA